MLSFRKISRFSGYLYKQIIPMLFSGDIMLQVTDATFKKEVLESEKPVIVDFWAEWCGPCRILGPRFEELSKEMTGVKFVKLNVDENMATSGSYSIRSIPTLLIFKKGEVAGNIIGAYPKEMIKQKIESSLQ